VVKVYTPTNIRKYVVFPQDYFDRLGHSPMVYSYCHALPTYHNWVWLIYCAWQQTLLLK